MRDDLLARLGGPLGAVARPVLDLAALPVPHAAELLVEDEVLAAGLDLLPRGAAVRDVGADLDEGREPELGLRLEAVGGVGALAEHVAHGLGLGVLVGNETEVAAVEGAGGVVAQLREEIEDCSASSFFHFSKYYSPRLNGCLNFLVTEATSRNLVLSFLLRNKCILNLLTKA